jgi:hypothetical protein
MPSSFRRPRSRRATCASICSIGARPSVRPTGPAPAWCSRDIAAARMQTNVFRQSEFPRLGSSLPAPPAGACRWRSPNFSPPRLPAPHRRTAAERDGTRQASDAPEPPRHAADTLPPGSGQSIPRDVEKIRVLPRLPLAEPAAPRLPPEHAVRGPRRPLGNLAVYAQIWAWPPASRCSSGYRLSPPHIKSLDRTATAARRTSLGAGNCTNPCCADSIRQAVEVREVPSSTRPAHDAGEWAGRLTEGCVLLAVFGAGDRWRLIRCIDSYAKARCNLDALDRVHQLTRCIDGLVAPTLKKSADRL